MIRFISGFALVWLALFLAAVTAGWEWFVFESLEQAWPLLTVKLLALPAAVAWFAVDALERFRPRLVFDSRARPGVKPVIFGLLAGCAAAVLCAAVFALIDAGIIRPWFSTHVFDLAVVGASAVIASLVGAMLLRRKRTGHCLVCDYDLSGLAGGRCPECGSLGSLVESGAQAG